MAYKIKFGTDGWIESVSRVVLLPISPIRWQVTEYK